MKSIYSYFFVFLCLMLWSCQSTKDSGQDILSFYLKKELSQNDFTQGKKLVQSAQLAYGGKDVWKAYNVARFHQQADWYGNLEASGWDELPQHFAMVTQLDSYNCEFFLINGKNKRQNWGIEEGKTYLLNANKEKEFQESKYKDKLIKKNFWFQFPFRIDEAETIAYLGSKESSGQKYDLVYLKGLTNDYFEDFVLFLNSKSRLIELVHYTEKEGSRLTQKTSQFTNFKKVKSLFLPYSQLVRAGKPDEAGSKLHENQYVEILLGTN